MRLPLILSLLALSTSSYADTTAPLTQGDPTQESWPEPAPQLMHLERALIQKQEARDKGELPPEKYQEFIAAFRVELEAAIGRIPPTDENKGLHAQILARLGPQEQGQALASLEQALAEDPKDPALLVAKGSILYEQRDFQTADALALQAWEASGRKDQRAWALHKMSEGRVSGVSSGEPAPRLKPASDFARLDWSIPERHDINEQGLERLGDAAKAFRAGDIAAAKLYTQEAMNADPTSKSMRDIFQYAQANFAKRAEIGTALENAVAAKEAGRHQDALVWMQKAYDLFPNDKAYKALQMARRNAAKDAARRAIEQPKTPRRSGPPPWAPFALLGVGAGLAGYGLYRFAKSRDGQTSEDEGGGYRGPDGVKRAWSEQESDKPQSGDENLERVHRNRYRLKVAAASVAVSVAIVYGGPWLVGTAGPVLIKVVRDGAGSLQQVMASEVGAINPTAVNAAKTAIWSPGKVGDPARNALGHWNKHKLEFPEFRNAKEYVEGAWKFIRTPPPGTLSKASSARAGETIFYNPTSNTLVIRGIDGAPKSMYRPDTALNKFATNLDYYNAQ